MNTQKMKKCIVSVAKALNWNKKYAVYKPRNLGTAKRGNWTVKYQQKGIDFIAGCEINDIAQVCQKLGLNFYATTETRILESNRQTATIIIH